MYPLRGSHRGLINKFCTSKSINMFFEKIGMNNQKHYIVLSKL